MRFNLKRFISTKIEKGHYRRYLSAHWSSTIRHRYCLFVTFHGSNSIETYLYSYRLLDFEKQEKSHSGKNRWTGFLFQVNIW